MSRIARIESRLQEALTLQFLEITDDSARHKGHGDFQGTDETHLTIRLAAAELQPLSRVEQHRRVMSLLANELNTGLHAVQLKIL